jgi:hypothetical protein
VQHRTAWEPPEVLPVRAVWTFGGGRCYSLAPASADLLLVHPLSSSLSVVLLEAARVSARRRLATSRMRTLRTPSFHIGAGRAFTKCIPTSDAPCRLPAPAVRLLLRPPAPPPFATLERTRFGFTERPESFHRPLAWRSHLPCTRRWRNDPRRLPLYRIDYLLSQIHSAFQPHGPGASRRLTDLNDMPSL